MTPETRDPGARPPLRRPNVVAAFDVDKTLTTHDCVVPFLRRVGGRRFLLRLAMRSPELAVAVVRRRRDRIKALATRAAVRGRRHDEIVDEARSFAEVVWERWMRPDTVARLRWHLEEGHRVVLVSASYRDYLEPLAERLGAHAVLSTELEVRDGICTGNLDGPNCRAAVKAERLRTWITEQKISGVEIHAYGDSAGDRDLLALADHPTLVRSSPIDVAPEVSTAESSPDGVPT
jgi:phosphatidylglycerophosphatase C